jgi:hypothetical protein
MKCKVPKDAPLFTPLMVSPYIVLASKCAKGLCRRSARLHNLIKPALLSYSVPGGLVEGISLAFVRKVLWNSLFLATGSGIFLFTGCVTFAGRLSGAPHELSQTRNAQALSRIETILIAPIEVHIPSSQVPLAELSAKLLDAFRSEIGDDAVAMQSTKETSLVAAFDRQIVEELTQFAEQERVDGILRTYLTRYVERMGSGVGAERPAEVSFRMVLTHRGGTVPLWTSTFGFKDTALIDNLIAPRPQGRVGDGWQTARVIASNAFSQVAREYAEGRFRQFEKKS